MSVDLEMAADLRKALSSLDNISERKMFGGLTFMWRGNMLRGTADDRYMFRVGKQQATRAETMPGAEAVVFNGRRMGGMYWVARQTCPEGLLLEWIALAQGFVGALKPKGDS